MPPYPKVCVVGNTVADILVYPERPVDSKAYGTQIMVKRPSELKLGGNGAITAVGLVRQGTPTYIICVVGGDRYGAFALKTLSSEGVDCSFVRSIEGSETANTIVLVHPETGERALIHNPGVGRVLEPQAIMQVPKGVEHVHIGSLFIMPALVPATLVPHLRRLRENFSGTISVDAAHDPTGAWEINGLLDLIDYFFANEVEARGIFGTTEPLELRDILEGYSGLKAIILKLGSEGSVIVAHNAIYRVGPGSGPGEVVDTTGAGDTYCSGFIHALLMDFDLRACGRAASALASWSTRFPGGTGYIMDKESIARMARSVTIQEVT